MLRCDGVRKKEKKEKKKGKKKKKKKMGRKKTDRCYEVRDGHPPTN